MKRKYCRIHLVSETICREKWHYYGTHLTIFFSFDSISIQLLLCLLYSLFFSFHAHFSFSSSNFFSTQWNNNLTACLGPIKSIYPSLKLVLAQCQWHSGKESTSQCRRHRRCRFDPWVGKIPWKRKWQSTPVFLPGKFPGQRSLVHCSPWGCRVRHNWVIEHTVTLSMKKLLHS